MKNRLVICWCLVVLSGLGTTVESSAQLPEHVEQKSNTFGDLRYSLTNSGIFGFDALDGEYGLFYPRESSNNYLFGSGLWFGARKWVRPAPDSARQLQKLSFITFNPASGQSWATPGIRNAPRPDDPATQSLFHSELYDQENGTSLESADAPRWPLWLLPGTESDPLYTGIYVINNGDRRPGGDPFVGPAFMRGVSEQFFMQYHDGEIDRYELGAAQAERLGYPIGLQISQNVYDWVFPGSLDKEATVIVQYRIVNVSSDTLFDCVAAQVADPDIGAAENDFQGLTSAARSALTWSKDESTDLKGLMLTLLESPVVDENGFVDNGSRGDFRTTGTVGTYRNWLVDSVLRTPEERYDFITSGVRDGFRGPNDWRSVMAGHKFHMAPGDTAHIAFAYSVIESIDTTVQPNPEAEALRETLFTEYYITGFRIEMPSNVSDHDDNRARVQMAPNPATSSVILSGQLPMSSRASLTVHDNVGRIVRRSTIDPSGNGTLHHSLDVGDLAPGSYLVTVRSGSYLTSQQLIIIR